MEDERIKNLFADFEPALSPDDDFMDKLQRNLHSVEMIRQRTSELQARHRKAMAIAAAVGFVAGILFAWLIPYLGQSVTAVAGAAASDSIFGFVSGHYYLFAWILAVGASVLLSLNSYELASALLRPRR